MKLGTTVRPFPADEFGVAGRALGVEIGKPGPCRGKKKHKECEEAREERGGSKTISSSYRKDEIV